MEVQLVEHVRQTFVWIGSPLHHIPVFDYLFTEFAVGYEWVMLNIGYILIVALLPPLLRLFNVGRIPLGPIPIIHNFFLCFWSLYMVIQTGRWVYDEGSTHGWEGLFCDSAALWNSFESRPYFYFYMFYISKYYEFIDTIILILRRKKLLTLHVWHHITTSLMHSMTYYHFVGVVWIGVMLNGTIHVFMYFYYGASELFSYQPWWKRYLTKAQITQFYLGLLISYGWVYFKWYKQMPCSGTYSSFFLPQLIVVTFIFLFLSFYAASYLRQGPTGTTIKSPPRGGGEDRYSTQKEKQAKQEAKKLK
jgi:fatty acid elongase 3